MVQLCRDGFRLNFSLSLVILQASSRIHDISLWLKFFKKQINSKFTQALKKLISAIYF